MCCKSLLLCSLLFYSLSVLMKEINFNAVIFFSYSRNYFFEIFAYTKFIEIFSCFYLKACFTFYVYICGSSKIDFCAQNEVRVKINSFSHMYIQLTQHNLLERIHFCCCIYVNFVINQMTTWCWSISEFPLLLDSSILASLPHWLRYHSLTSLHFLQCKTSSFVCGVPPQLAIVVIGPLNFHINFKIN